MSQFVKLRSGQVHIQMLWSLCSRCDERKVDVCGGGGRQFLLCLFRCLLQSLKSHLVSGKIYALCLLKLIDHPVCDGIVKIIAAKTCIAVGRENFDYAVTDFDDGNIEGTAAKVIYHDFLLFLIVKAVSQCSSSRLVDNTLYVQTGNLSCILGCLTLCVIKVSGNCDNCLRNRLTQIALCVCLQFLKDHCGDLLRCVLLSVNVYLVICTHMALNGRNGAVCICNSLTLCRLAYQSLSCLCKCHDGWSCSYSFCVGDNGWLSAFHNGHTAICCT